jgi:hypothetical protein
MACARNSVLAPGPLLFLLSGIIHGEEAKTPLKDLYCDPLPLAVVMRLGTIHRAGTHRHAAGTRDFAETGGRRGIAGNAHGASGAATVKM